MDAKDNQGHPRIIRKKELEEKERYKK